VSGAGSDFTAALPIVKHDDPIRARSCSSEKKLIEVDSQNRPFGERSTARYPRRFLPAEDAKSPNRPRERGS
jgi:hypothetical protein